MSRKIKSFASHSFESKAENTLFQNKGAILVYVEGPDDVKFYETFLKTVFPNNLVKPIFLGNKEKVIQRNIKQNNNKNGFIADSDYTLYESYKVHNNFVLTTGYSMENFFFYFDESDINHNNLKNIFNTLLQDRLKSNVILKDNIKKIKKEFYEEFYNQMIDYKTRTLNFYAAHKTVLSNEQKSCMKKTEIEKVSFTETDARVMFIKTFEDGLENINLYLKQFNDNKKYINESGFLMLRGHDIFDKMLGFLNRKIKEINNTIEDETQKIKIIDKDEVLNSSSVLFRPLSFIEQFDKFKKMNNIK